MGECVATATTAVAHTPVTLHCAAAASSTTDWIIAVGTVIAAVGTVAAVSYALWQGRRQETSDLRVEITRGAESKIGDDAITDVLYLKGTNFGPAPVRVTGYTLPYKLRPEPERGLGGGMGLSEPRGPRDRLPADLQVGESITLDWDFNHLERSRQESNGEPYTHGAFFDSLGREYAAPFIGMREKRGWLRRLRRQPREYEPIKPPKK